MANKSDFTSTLASHDPLVVQGKEIAKGKLFGGDGIVYILIVVLITWLHTYFKTKELHPQRG